MKKKLLSIIFLLSIFILPLNVFAGEYKVSGNKYNTKNFIETLEEEGITPKVSDYQEGDNKINIYIFTGKGCEHCINFLNFLNDISPDYSQYFNVISFEIYGDANNATLLKSLARSIAVEDDGVPFVFIGDKYFNGYSEEYNEDIKTAIKETYDTEKVYRTDIMKAFEKQTGYVEKTPGLSDVAKIVLFDLFFTAVSTIIIIIFINTKFNSLNNNDNNKKKK